MTSRRTRSAFAWAALLGLAITGAACSSDDDGGDEPDTAETGTADETDDGGRRDERDDDEAAEALAAETARADGAEAELAAAEAELAVQTQAAEEAEAQVDELTTALTGETARADTAQEDLDDISALFPITIDSAIAGPGIDFNLAGAYNLTWEEAYCDTFASCGTLPATTGVTIATTPEGWLELQVPNLFTVALFAVQGSLYGVTDTTQLLPPCGDTPQVSRVTVTIYADGVTIQPDGSRTIEQLGSAVTVSGSFAPGCAGGTIFYGAELVRA